MRVEASQSSVDCVRTIGLSGLVAPSDVYTLSLAVLNDSALEERYERGGGVCGALIISRELGGVRSGVGGLL